MAVLGKAPSVPAPVARRAVEWMVELQSGGPNGAANQAFLAWLNQHPDHERAWRHIEAVNLQLRGLTAPAAVQAALTSAQAGPDRRQAIKTLALLMFAGGGTWAVHSRMPWREWVAEERTAVGQQRALTLADGTRVDLNTDTAINLRFSPLERRLQLVSGEVLITTAPDPEQPVRPFVVSTVQGEVRPLGTRFALRQFSEVCKVNVYEGAVEIHPQNTPWTQTLQAGEQTCFDASGINGITPVSAGELAWVQGMIVSSSMRLTDFLAELGRYRTGMVNCDPAIADLRVSGTFPLENTDRILTALAATLPVEVQYRTRYWVQVRARRLV